MCCANKCWHKPELLKCTQSLSSPELFIASICFHDALRLNCIIASFPTRWTSRGHCDKTTHMSCLGPIGKRDSPRGENIDWLKGVKDKMAGAFFKVRSARESLATPKPSLLTARAAYSR